MTWTCMSEPAPGRFCTSILYHRWSLGMAEWFDDEAFWRDLYPFMFTQERFEQASDEVEKIIKLTGVENGAALDLCCGPGRHTIQLASRGFTVTGVDKTGFLLQKAREHAAAACVDIDFIRQDMREYVRPAAYDLAVSMFTSFGYFAKKGEDIRVLSHLHKSLKPGGILVMEMQGKERLAREFQPIGGRELPDGRMLVEYRTIYDGWSRIHNKWILIDGEKARTFRLDITAYSGQELKDRLMAAGFSSIYLYGDLEGTEYGPTAKRLIAVARK
ncbi:MAG: methyltransferase domain-containing protein [Chitinivibrionales bacterium]|nr:methyltransferase domain-containing protein [Chitinivibrionales bacterium]MBD3358821.1 methyltransferase domain-containing protein [Chitinivibrionales bacterium]